MEEVVVLLLLICAYFSLIIYMYTHTHTLEFIHVNGQVIGWDLPNSQGHMDSHVTQMLLLWGTNL